MAAVKVGPGMYRFEAETDPVKVAAAEQSFNEWHGLFKKIVEARDQHGWDSPECQLARMDMTDWQLERRRQKNDQAHSA